MAARQTDADPPPLAQPVSALHGVGPERAALFARLEIHTVEDLLLHRPRRYEDRRQFLAIAQLQLDQPALCRGTIVAQGIKWFRLRQKSIFELILDDGTARLHCRWWNLPFMEKYFALGQDVVVFGRPLSLKPRTIDHPETEVVDGAQPDSLHLNRIVPIYPLTEGLAQRWLRALIWRTLSCAQPHLLDPWPELTAPPSPWPSFSQALNHLHFPDAENQIEEARQRLALDEFIQFQLRIQARRRNFENRALPRPCPGDNHLIKPFLARLGFELTPAQTHVLRELRRDMAGPFPMRRLLQGDVGSGKTVVAAACALMALESGFNVLLMAPTEILAEQHFATFQRWFLPLGLTVSLRTGSRKSLDLNRTKSPPAAAPAPPRLNLDTPDPETATPAPAGPPPCLSEPRPGLIVGTHALLTPDFDCADPGLVIIDEQHKFGVAQREQLVRKGHYPHLLVMTATPIPRTLGLTLYGELDVSVIASSPPGRGRIRTFVRSADSLPKVWAFIREQLEAGRQAYVVYPRVEDAGAGAIKAVKKDLDQVRTALAPFRVELMHGRLKSAEKDEVMAGFRDGRIQVLLATSLVEVGLDVPNASVLLVENAEQFGLTQLHQLRGRIGRGSRDSYCILVATAETPEAKQRLRVLAQTTDGFQIAEADLQLRGPGELLGQQQSGAPKFRFGDLARDWALLHKAREVAARAVVDLIT